MNQQKLIAALCAGLLFAATGIARAAPDGQRVNAFLDHRGDCIDHRLDRRGDRIDYRLDQRGDRVDRHLDRAAEHAGAAGRDHPADRLDRKGDRIDHHLDRNGDPSSGIWTIRATASSGTGITTGTDCSGRSPGPLTVPGESRVYGNQAAHNEGNG